MSLKGVLKVRLYRYLFVRDLRGNFPKVVVLSTKVTKEHISLKA